MPIGSLKNKIDHGADFVITQLFSGTATTSECRDYLARLARADRSRLSVVVSTAQIKLRRAVRRRLPPALLSGLRSAGTKR